MTPERKPNVFNTPRFSQTEKNRLDALVTQAQGELTLLLGGMKSGLYGKTMRLRYYIAHNIQAAQAGLSLEDIRTEVNDLTAGVEMVRAQKNLGNSGSSEMH